MAIRRVPFLAGIEPVKIAKRSSADAPVPHAASVARSGGRSACRAEAVEAIVRSAAARAARRTSSGYCSW
jgi:hypothetical protein